VELSKCPQPPNGTDNRRNKTRLDSSIFAEPKKTANRKYITETSLHNSETVATA
jgi:hypothetical protein